MERERVSNLEQILLGIGLLLTWPKGGDLPFLLDCCSYHQSVSTFRGRFVVFSSLWPYILRGSYSWSIFIYILLNGFQWLQKHQFNHTWQLTEIQNIHPQNKYFCLFSKPNTKCLDFHEKLYCIFYLFALLTDEHFLPQQDYFQVILLFSISNVQILRTECL